jgi:hypothetical protein
VAQGVGPEFKPQYLKKKKRDPREKEHVKIEAEIEVMQPTATRNCQTAGRSLP